MTSLLYSEDEKQATVPPICAAGIRNVQSLPWQFHLKTGFAGSWTVGLTCRECSNRWEPEK